MSSTQNTRSDPQERVIAEFVTLTPGEADAHRLFSHLARVTNDELVKLGLYRGPLSFSPDIGSFGLTRVRRVGAEVSDDLLHDWERFAVQYRDLARRNPRLELYDLMQDISERALFESWPQGAEWDIERWISEGAPADGRALYPVDDDIRARLVELHPILGGWLYLDDTCTVTFAETAAFRHVKVRRDAEREERIRLGKAEHDAAMQRLELARRGSTAVQFGGVTLYLKDKEAAVELQRRLGGVPGHELP